MSRVRPPGWDGERVCALKPGLCGLSRGDCPQAGALGVATMGGRSGEARGWRRSRGAVCEWAMGEPPVSTARGKAPCPSQPPSSGLKRGGLRAEAWRGARRQAREAPGSPDGAGRGPGVGTAVWGQARSHPGVSAPGFPCSSNSLTVF